MEAHEIHQELMEKLRLLHLTRLSLAANKATLHAEVDAVYALNAHLVEVIREEEALLSKTDAEVRAEALRLYQTIPNAGKTDFPGVTIRETIVYTFPAQALDWAIEHKVALKLDEPAYKKLIGANVAPGEVRLTLTAAIAADLSDLVKG